MSETQPALSADEVASWLEAHPDFLASRPELALRLVIPRQDGQTASLVGYQLEQLRCRSQGLEQRLAQLSANAQANEVLVRRIHALGLALIVQHTWAGTVQTLVERLTADFEGDHVALLLHQTPPEPLEADWLQVLAPEDPRLQSLPASLLDGEVLCGRLPPDRNALFHGCHAARIHSSAIVPLPGVGLLAVGSADPNHFWPGMGTVFLDMMGQILVAALSRFQ